MDFILSKLAQVAEEIEAGEAQNAEILLAQAEAMVVNQATPMERLGHLFVQALQARMHGDLSGAGNLYGSGEPLTEQDLLLAYQTLLARSPSRGDRHCQGRRPPPGTEAASVCGDLILA